MDQEPLGFADAHIHPTESIPQKMYPDLERAEVLFGCTYNASEWGPMSRLVIPGLVRSYGVHPWNPWVWTSEAEAELRGILESDPKAGIGEIGLDSKKGSVSAQVPVFEAQLSLAEEYGRMVSIHCVGCEKEVLDILRTHRLDRVIMHGFSEESYAVPFVKLGCRLSVNPRILARSETRLRRLFSSIPEDRFLMESDAPFTPKFAGMGRFASDLAGIVGSDGDALTGRALDNARSLL